MKEITKVLLAALGLAVFLPITVVVAFEVIPEPFGIAFVGALFIGVVLLVVVAGTRQTAEDGA